jgi:hypothetical protein
VRFGWGYAKGTNLIDATAQWVERGGVEDGYEWMEDVEKSALVRGMRLDILVI